MPYCHPANGSIQLVQATAAGPLSPADDKDANGTAVDVFCHARSRSVNDTTGVL